MSEAKIAIGSFASEVEALDWIRERTNGVFSAAASNEQLVYSSVWRNWIWLGVKDPSRRFSVQRLFRARLERQGDDWLLVGRMVLPISPRINLSLIACFGVAALLFGSWNAAAGTDVIAVVGPSLLGVVFMGLVVALLAASRRSARDDLPRLRESLVRPRA